MEAIMTGAMLALATMTASAADSRGAFVGGGVGALGCPEFGHCAATWRCKNPRGRQRSELAR
jgi:hypothetical protein